MAHLPPTGSPPDDAPGEPFAMPAEGGQTPRKWGVPGLLTLIIVIYSAYMMGVVGGRNEHHPLPVTALADSGPKAVNPRVFVTGRVARPGVYTLPPDARVQDAIRRAGGTLKDADRDALNLADWVQDGGKIFVPSRNRPRRPAEEPPAPTRRKTKRGARVEPQPRPTRTPRPPKPKTPRPTPVPTAVPEPLGPLDLNRATAAQLDRLPGVGPALATEILAYRDRHAGIRSVEELDQVPGIGPAKLDKMRPYVYVE